MTDEKPIRKIDCEDCPIHVEVRRNTRCCETCTAESPAYDITKVRKKPIRSLKEQLEEAAFYVEDSKRLTRPRRVCVHTCDQWKGTDQEGYVWCDDYCVGWCKHSFKGVLEGESFIPLSKAKELLDDAAASYPMITSCEFDLWTARHEWFKTVFGAGLDFGKSSSEEEKGSGRESGLDCGGTVLGQTTESEPASPPRTIQCCVGCKVHHLEGLEKILGPCTCPCHTDDSWQPKRITLEQPSRAQEKEEAQKS